MWWNGVYLGSLPLASIKFAGRRIELPRSRLLRIGLGIVFVLGGIFSILPVLGLWMLPVGLMILASDNGRIRRFNRRAFVAIMERWNAWRGKPRRKWLRIGNRDDEA